MSPELKVVTEFQVGQFTPVIPDASRLDWVKTVSDWTVGAANKGLMLPKSQEQILDLFSKGHSLVMVGRDDKIVSHAAATFFYLDKSIIEVGAVYTEESKREKGLGAKTVGALLGHLNELYPDAKTIFALANQKATPLFKDLGGTEMETNELHKDVWLACKDCPNKLIVGADGKHVCCDTPFDLTKVAKRENKIIFDASIHGNGGNGANHVNI
ncbi:MAG: hypothetical protein HW400_325 [Candidatus Levybacteria bacterium]|nr:hypothetical protein [Candidatus Levybacteria bacterium]